MPNLPAPKHAQPPPSRGQGSDHRDWIADRIFTLLSHFWRDDDSTELTRAIGRDWVDVLEPLSQPDIDRACKKWMRTQRGRKPTPGDIYALAQVNQKPVVGDRGDRGTLSHDERVLLEEKVIPTARHWLGSGLDEHGRKTLEYWGEIP